MQIVTWNVNSIRARMPRVLEFLDRVQPDIVCLQETKVVDELFPQSILEDAGYQVAFYGQKTYNGVAILAKSRIEDVHMGFGEAEFDREARVIAATVGDVMLLNLYVVNGKEVGDQKFVYKLAWMDCLKNYIQEHFPMQEKVVVCGDFNVTFDARDVYDPEKWEGKIHCSEPERAALGQLMDLGLVDALRVFHEQPEIYTWWDFRTRGFRDNRGLRIDHFLCSPELMKHATDVRVDLEARGGEKPSDHAPVILELR
jgi:exodeoxyribonuclease III